MYYSKFVHSDSVIKKKNPWRDNYIKKLNSIPWLQDFNQKLERTEVENFYQLF